ncbi:MAG: ATP-binding protein, partial [Candidatus Thorarchaeota archaeon]
SPISLWEEDFSASKEYLDQLKASGITDFREYFTQHPEELLKCVKILKVLDVNKASLDYHGVETKEELINGLPDLLRDDTRRAFIEVFIAVANGDISFETESEVRTASGEMKTELLQWVVPPGYEETYGKVFLSVIDITESKRAEDALLESKQHYEALFENNPTCLWEEDFSAVKTYLDDLKSSGIQDIRKHLTSNHDALLKCVNLIKIIDVNQATLDLHKVKSKEELLEGFSQLLTDDAKPLFIDEFVAISEGKTSFDSETAYVTVSGEKRYLLLKWILQPDHTETYDKVIVSIVDISERKRAEDALTRERKAIGIMANAAVQAESMPDLCQRILSGIVDTLDFDAGTLRLINEAGTHLRLFASTGFTDDQLITDVSLNGGKGSDYIVADVARTKKMIFAPQAYSPEEAKLKMKRAKDLGLESIILWPILDAQKNLVGVLNIGAKEGKELDNSDRVFFETLAEILTTAVERMKAKDQMEVAWTRAEFFNDLMAHDLNNVHQGLLTTLELMLYDESFPAEYRGRAEAALGQVQRSLDLIANVRKFSHIDKLGRADLKRTDVYSVLMDAIIAVEHTFPNKRLAPNISFKLGQHFVMIDEFFVDVLYNLLHNSMKFDGDEEVKVDISADMDERREYLEIRIADYGSGISDDQKDKLFTRLGPTKASGSGIGLTLVKRIIERYGGKIWVENRIPDEMGSGACFVICLHQTHYQL